MMTYPPSPPICPKCNLNMVLRETNKFIRPSGKNTKFWGCRNYPNCTIAVGAHDDGTPMGFPAPDKETARARNLAHAVFDPIWREKRITRNDAYHRIAEIMGIPSKECHIGMFSINECRRFIKAAHILIKMMNERDERIRNQSGEVRQEWNRSFGQKIKTQQYKHRRRRN